MDRVIRCIADNVVSPLGTTSRANYDSVRAGKSGLGRYESMGNISTPFVLSRVDRAVIDGLCAELGILGNYTFFEKFLLCSSVQAVKDAGIDASSDRVLFVISTTKGNVSLLGEPQEGISQERVLLAKAAREVIRYFGNPGNPIVVCNACIFLFEFFDTDLKGIKIKRIIGIKERYKVSAYHIKADIPGKTKAFILLMDNTDPVILPSPFLAHGT